MARRRASKKRSPQPDSRYGNAVFGKIINGLMWEGKKSVAESIFYEAMDIISADGKDPVEVIQAALAAVKPGVEVRSRRVGGATYSVPIPISPIRAGSLSVRWLIHAARTRTEKTMKERLAREILQASTEAGAAVKKRMDTHRMAAANQAFAHYRWS